MVTHFLLIFTFLLPLANICTELTRQAGVFKNPTVFNPSEFQALIIRLDYGTSPETQRTSRREKIALKLTQITKTITDSEN
jgi:hypothetical protein